MMPNWNVLLTIMLLICISTMLIATLVSNLRFSVKKEWITIALCIFIYLACMATSVFLSSFSQQLEKIAQDMSHPSSLPNITKDWGNDLSGENRTKYSRGIAQSIFVREGAFRDYIDLNGQKREYEPTKSDRQLRTNYMILIEQIKFNSRYFIWMSFIWLLVPLYGVIIGFTSWPQRYLSFINKCKLKLTNK